MQLFLILGILAAVGAVSFALQNDVPVSVMLSNWRFDSSLAVILLLALALGALIAALVSTPSVIKGQWARARLRRQIASLQKDKDVLEQRLRQIEQEIARLAPEPAPSTGRPEPYVGLKSTLLSSDHDKPNDDASTARVMQRARRS